MGLKEARKRAGLTAIEAANAIGVSAQNVYNWEAGSYYPSKDRLLSIAELYGCSVDELLRGEVKT